MNFKAYFFMSTVLLFFVIQAEEFVYPVGILSKKQEKLYLLYQKSLNHVELWLWNSQTKEAHKGLLSTFTPAGLKILPDHTGFSFVDNGRLRIKQFNKRSPQTVAIYEPVYDVSSIEWLSGKKFYFSARQKGRYAIFESTIDGDVRTLIRDEDHDCLYPQKQENELFYIERCPTGAHYFMVAPYLTDHSVVDPDSVRTLLIDFDRQSVAFLHMASATVGYCISHPSSIGSSAKTIECFCHRLHKEGGEWVNTQLFSFTLPLYLLIGHDNSRLYESMLPLLPRYEGDEITFVSSKSGEEYALDIYSYHEGTRAIATRSTTARHNESFFAPVRCNNRVYYGGLIHHDQSKGVKMWINQDGVTCFDLPWYATSVAA